MDKSNTLFLIASLLFSCVMFVISSSQVIEESTTPSFIKDDVISPAPSPELVRCVKSAKVIFTSKCGDQIFNAIFKGNSTYTYECCVQQIRVGKPCNDILTKNIISIPKFNITNPSQALQNNEEVWYKCVLLVENISPAPSFSMGL